MNRATIHIRPRTLFCTALLAGIAASASAQAGGSATAIDLARRAAMLESGEKFRHPAEFALEHKAELGLTPRQIGLIQHLVKAQRDSGVVRSARVTAAMRAQARSPNATARSMVAWSGPIEEKALRDEACERSAAQAEMLIGTIRDRHAVGAILTDEQRRRIPMIQVQATRSALGKP